LVVKIDSPLSPTPSPSSPPQHHAAVKHEALALLRRQFSVNFNILLRFENAYSL